MSKKRGKQGADRSVESAETSGPARGPERDPALHDQGQMGNSALQARMGGESEHGTGLEQADLVAQMALPAVERALLVLQLDPHDPARVERLSQIVERSNLPDKHDLQMRLETDAAMRAAVDGLLDRHFGGHDADTRWRVDAAMSAVVESLKGGLEGGVWVDGKGAVSLGEGVSAGSLTDRSSALIEALAEARTPEPSGRPVASLVRSLALVATLDEDEEEEDEWAGSSPELG